MTLRHPSIAALVTVGVFATLAAAPAGQDVTLRYRWTKGETLRYRQTQESTVNMSGVPGQGDMTVATTMGQVMALTADDVAADGIATVRLTFESMRMSASTPAGSINYDSTSPTPPSDPISAQVGQMLGAMVGQSITMILTPTGAVQKVEGLTKLMSAMQQKMPGGAGALSGLEGFTTDEGMQATFGQQFAFFPTGAVKPGDTWNHEVKVPNPFGTVATAMTHTLRGVETLDGRSVTRITSVVATKMVAPAANPTMPMTVEMGDGTGETEIWFDHGRGRVVKSVGHVSMPMSMTMTAPDGSTVSMGMSTRTVVTMELVEKQ